MPILPPTPSAPADPNLAAPYFVPGGQAILGPQTIPMDKVRTNEIGNMLMWEGAQKAQAFDDARRQALQQEADDMAVRQAMQQSRATDNQLKAIQSQRRFSATRRLGQQVEALVGQGHSREEALAIALPLNLGAMAGDTTDLVRANAAAAATKARSQFRPGEVIPFLANGRQIGQGYMATPDSIHPITPSITGAASPATLGQLINAKAALARLRGQEVKALADSTLLGKPAERQAAKDRLATSQTSYDDAMKAVEDAIKAAEATGGEQAVVPPPILPGTAAPPPAAVVTQPAPAAAAAPAPAGPPATKQVFDPISGKLKIVPR